MEEIEPKDNVIIVEDIDGKLNTIYVSYIESGTIMPNIGDELILNFIYVVERRVFDFNQNKLIIYVKRKQH